MKREVRIPMIKGQELVLEPVKIVESSKKRGEKVSLATKIDDGFIFNLMFEKENIGKFLDLEVDVENKTLIIHFERVNKQLEKELAHEMR